MEQYSLDSELYLFDPPETVWDRILLMDHAAWFDHKDMEVLSKASEQSRTINQDIPREAWLGLYAASNPLKELSSGGDAVLLSLFRRAEELDEWKRLRLTVGMDPIAAAFGAAHFVTNLIEKLPPEVKESMEANQRANDQVNNLQDQLDIAQSLASGTGRRGSEPFSAGDSVNYEDLIAKLQSKMEAAKEEVASTQRAVLDALDAAQARTSQSLAQALDQSSEELSDLQKAAGEFGVGWGIGGGGGVSREHLDGLHELSEYLRKSPSVKLILESLGWAKSLVTRERRKSTRGHETFTHFKVQDLDIETLSPDELVSMIAFDQESPLYLDFLCRALDGDLLHAQFEGKNFAGKGPIVFLRDESGSMKGARRATACALQLAIMLDARKKDRRFVSIPFSDRGQFTVYDPGSHPDPHELLQHLDLNYGKGTEPVRHVVH